MEISLNDGPWTVVEGTTAWTTDIPISELGTGWNEVQVRAYEGELYSVNNETRFFLPPDDPNGVPDNGEPSGGSVVYLGIAVVFMMTTLLAVGYVLWDRRTRRDS